METKELHFDRTKEFRLLVANASSLTEVPRDIPMAELQRSTLEKINNMLTKFQTLFNESQQRDEQILFAECIRELNKHKEHLADNETYAPIAWNYIEALSQGLELY